MEKKKHSKKFTVLVSAAVLIASLVRCGTYVGIKQLEYYNTISHEDKYKLSKENDKFVELVEKTKKGSVTLTSAGNSIGFGFSLTQANIPLLLRDQNLIDELKSHGIDCTEFNVARMQNNDDEKTYNLLIGNVKLSDIYEMDRQDYVKNRAQVKSGHITAKNIEEYYPKTVNNDETFGEIALNNDNNNMNIIVYNGCTGSFLDGLTRSDNISGMLSAFNGFSRDTASIRSFCEYIYLKNPHTQIYLCGVPNFLNLGITDGINDGLKEIADSYPNVIFVDPIVVNVFQKNGEDIHPTTEEYQRQVTNIMESICKNYISRSICIDLDVSLKTLNTDIELYHRELKNNEEVVRTVVEGVLADYDYASKDDIKNATDAFLKLYKMNRSYDYSYISETILKDIFNDCTLEVTSNNTTYDLEDKPYVKRYKPSFYQRSGKMIV